MRRLHEQTLRSLLILLAALSLTLPIGCGGGEDDPFDNQNMEIPDVGIPDADPQDPNDADPQDPDDADPQDPDDADPQDPDDADPQEPDDTDTQDPVDPTDGRCTVTPGTNGYLLFRGTLLAGDDVFDDGSLLVDDQAPNRKIVCAGNDCDDDDKAQDATIIDCPTGVISPGFLNPHDHLTFAEGRPQKHGDARFDHRNDWRNGIRGNRKISTKPRQNSGREGVLLGELRMLFGGSTSIAGSSGTADASGLLRNLDSDHTEGLPEIDVRSSTFPLGDNNSQLDETSCTFTGVDSENNVTNRGIYLPHVAEGIDSRAQLEIKCLAGESGRNLIRENTSIIHGIAVDARDVALIADRGAKLVWSPRTNIDLYGNTAPVTLYKTFGVPIALGTDWSTSGSMNMLRELQCADYLNQNHFNKTFSDQEIWQMATSNAALSLGAQDLLGSLLEGYVADIAIFDAKDRLPYRAVIDAEIDDVIAVLRGGEPLYGDANIIEGLVPDNEIDTCESVDVCSRDRRLCLERDANITLDGIWAKVHTNSYPIFFCGEPDDEPTCIPSRPNEYDGIPTDTDRSGDGVSDADDNCPDYFNPIRPMDGNAQSNVNNTSFGDVCDPCPLSEDPNCTEVDPNDWSGDGWPNDEDNCPFHYNPLQEDTSGDGIGDVCHPCPEQKLADGATCAGSIYDINTEVIKNGELISIKNAIVTASLPGEGLFVQVHPDDSDYAGPENSGLYIYLRNYSGTFPTVGDRVDLTGSVSHFYGQIQLANINQVEILSSDNTLPDPEVVDPVDVANNGPRQKSLEGVLITVEHLTVSDTDPAPGDGLNTTNDYVVDDGLRIGDFFYLTDPFPNEGDFIRSITGVLHWHHQNSKVQPRSADDIILGDPELAALLPETLFLEVSDDPAPLLTLTLTRPAEEDLVIDLNYSVDDTILDGPDTVEILEGDQSVEIDIKALSTSDDPIIVEASLDGVTVSATIITYDDSTERFLEAFGADEDILTTESTLTLVAELNIPASDPGQSLNFAIEPVNNFIYDSTYTFDPGQKTLEIKVQLSDEVGEFTATATLGTDSIPFDFEVIDIGEEFVETFDNFDSPGGGYATDSFVGDAGFVWHYANARTGPVGNDAPAIDEPSLLFGPKKNGDRYLRAENIPGGIRTFRVEMMKAFTGIGDRQMELFINGESVGISETFGSPSGKDTTIRIFEVNDIKVQGEPVRGEFDLELRNLGEQVTIDNLTWTAF